MSLESNKMLVQRYYREIKNFGEACEALFDKENFISRMRSDPEMDFEAYKKTMILFYTAFPNLTNELIDITAEDDRVTVYLRGTGHHQGTFMNIPPQQHKCSAFAFHQFKIVDNKIVEHRSVADLFSLANQIGAIEKSTEL